MTEEILNEDILDDDVVESSPTAKTSAGAKAKNKGGRPKGSTDKSKRRQKHLSGIARPPASRTRVKGGEIPNDPKSLAALIRADREEEEEGLLLDEGAGEVEVVPAPAAMRQFLQPPVQPPIRHQAAPAVKAPIALMAGGHPLEPVVVRRSEREVFSWLDDKFRPVGGYFILSEQTNTRTVKGRVSKRKCVYVEDSNGFRYHIWFDVSALSLV